MLKLSLPFPAGEEPEDLLFSGVEQLKLDKGMRPCQSSIASCGSSVVKGAAWKGQ